MDNLKLLRDEKELTQLQLGLRIGVSSSAIQQYESGVNYPTLENTIQLADYFGVSIDFLLGRTTVRNFVEEQDKQMASLLRHVQSDVIKRAVIDILDELTRPVV